MHLYLPPAAARVFRGLQQSSGYSRRIFAAGRMNGVYDLAASPDGRCAGSRRSSCGIRVPSGSSRRAQHRLSLARFPIFDHPEPRTFVRLRRGPAGKDLENARRKDSISSRTAQALQHGVHWPLAGQAFQLTRCILARIRGVGVEQLVLTTARPMYHPVPLKLLAAAASTPEELSPCDAQHGAFGARCGCRLATGETLILCSVRRSRAQSIDARGSRGTHSVRASSMWDARQHRVYGPGSPLLDRLCPDDFSL